VVLAKKAHEWVINSFQPLLGPAHTNQLLRMSAHLLDEFRLQRSVGDGNVAYNEMLYQFVKAANKLTNRRWGQFVEQFFVNKQLLIVLPEEKDGEDEGETARNESYSTTCSDGQRRRRHRRRRLWRRWKHSEKRPTAQLAEPFSFPGVAAAIRRSAELDESRGLPVLEAAFTCDETTLFSISTNLFFGNLSRRHRRSGFTVRETPSFHRSPWFDRLQNKGPDVDVRIGQAALAVTTRARGWERLAVRRAERLPLGLDVYSPSAIASI